MPEILLFRHGETRWNLEGRMQGQGDSPLTLKGIAQARAYGQALRQTPELRQLDLDKYHLVSSPLPRCLQSMSLMMEEAGLSNPVAIAPALAEVNVGTWSGRLKSELPQNMTQGSGKDYWVFHAPMGETYAQLVIRIRHWLDHQQPGAKLLVMSHGIAGKVLRGLYLGLDAEQTMAQDAPQNAFFHLVDRKLYRYSTKAGALMEQVF